MNKKKTAELPSELNWRKYLYNVEYGKALYYKENEGTENEKWYGCIVAKKIDKKNPENLIVVSAQGRFQGEVSMPASKLYRFQFGMPLTLDFAYDIPSRQAHKKFYDLYFQLGKDFKEAIKDKVPEGGITFLSFTSFLQYCNDFTKKEIKAGYFVDSTRIQFEGLEYDINHRLIIGNYDYLLDLQEKFERTTWDCTFVVSVDDRVNNDKIRKEYPFPTNDGRERHKNQAMPYNDSTEKTKMFIKSLRWFYQTYLEK